MDQESLAQIRHIVTEATEAVETRLGARIGSVEGHLDERINLVEGRLGARIDSVEGRLRERIDEVDRHTGVLIEDIHHRFDLMVEHHDSLRQHIVEDIRAEFQQESQETRALLRLSYQQPHQRVENLEPRVLAIEQRLGITA